ncbi:hypothetical protein COLO4_00182 [Corchorus olitorius]|uniref:Uncharacterized protein n=1 Tax=Corchorus olitorius TaxID=93759 RepID=A0A1R3L4E1_9ROSI|nr:hypothetical protein COLO4_00182 [Corchorus olitorius]
MAQKPINKVQQKEVPKEMPRPKSRYSSPTTKIKGKPKTQNKRKPKENDP